MALRNQYSYGGKPMAIRHDLARKIEQAHDLAALARQDGDMKDFDRWVKKAKRLESIAVSEGGF